MSQSGGSIICEQSYAQGKMLDHSRWHLSRGVTPSDIDFVVESYGCFLWCELTKNACDWDSLKTGQRMLYDSLAKIPGNNVVCLARHSVPRGKKVDTFNDIEAVAVRWACGSKSLLLEKSGWQTLVTEWVPRPQQVIASLDRHHAALAEKSNGC
jgi:hypothetical protein